MAGKRTTIWRLLKSCAEELTAQGRTPFSRGDLIACVQRHAPEYGPNSINPVIQGITSNLRGGAPGAVGKNILYSTGRGRFVLQRQAKDHAQAAAAQPPRTTTRRHKSRPAVKPRHPGGAIPRLELSQTLFVLPCSGQKRSVRHAPAGPSVMADLPPDIADELLAQRTRHAASASIDESTLAKALDRYDGTLYQIARPAIEQLIDQGAHVLILSGGYGLVRGTEPIGLYDARFRVSAWKHHIIERSLAAWAERAPVTTVVGILSGSTDYAKVFRKTQWPQNVSQVFLASPERAAGAMVKAPRAQGEALATIARSGYLPEQWQSSDGLAMEITRLETDTPDAFAKARQILTDESNACSPDSFPQDPDVVSRPGLYSWWADQSARKLIGQVLQTDIPALIYIGQAGATHWPSGKRPSTTLSTRIRTSHINGNASSSTFRLTISAILMEPLGLKVDKPGRLIPQDRKRVSDWIRQHLKVAVVAHPDRDSLEQLEQQILASVDPPLNLMGMAPTPVRKRLSRLRKAITCETGNNNITQ